MKKNTIKRYTALFTGTALISLGIAIFLKADLGVDPFTLFALGLSSTLGISFMFTQWLINGVILLGVFFIDAKKIYIATIINMITIAPMIELFLNLINRFFADGSGLVQNILIVALGCIVLAGGAGMYIAANLGFAPYDLVGIITAERKKIHYRWARIGTDTLCVIAGYYMGESLGIGTVIAAFCLGPLIELFKTSTEKYFLHIEKSQK